MIDTVKVAYILDKYEFNIKVEQIKKLAAKKSYKEAAEIAKEMNWQKVKDWSTLATVINVQEAAGDYVEARDMAILAYNRNLGGRKLVYKLTELLIKLEDFETAEELYEEYEKMSQHDVNRYILFYDLRKAQKASDNELVEILEDYKEHEIDEKYMFELAELYSKTGRKEECIKTCDDIVLWFQDGVFVERAIQLKQQFGAELTNTQKKILEETRKQKQDVEATKELMFEEQKRLAALRSDDIEEAMQDDEDFDVDLTADEDSIGGIKSFFKKAFGGHGNGKEKDYIHTELEYEYEDEDTEYDEAKEAEPVKESEEPEVKKGMSKEDTALYKEVKPNETGYNEGSDTLSDSIDKASLSLRELIEDAKKKLESNYGELNSKDKEHEAKEEHEASAAGVSKTLEDTNEINSIKVDIPSYDNPYDTQNLQAAIAKNLNEFLEEDKAEAEALRPQPVSESSDSQTDGEEQLNDDQIEGQLSLADWMEAVREEKYGKQNTREFSKSELERMLDEKDEKSAAYEKIMAEQKAQAEAAGKEFNEKEASRKAHAQVMIQAARTDLAIRTGKATVRLENAAAEVRRQQEELRQEAVRQEALREEVLRQEEARNRQAKEQEKADKRKAQLAAQKEMQRLQEIRQLEETAASDEEKTVNIISSNAASFKVVTDTHNDERETAEPVPLYTAPVKYVTEDMLNINPLEAISTADLANAVKQEEADTENGRRLTGELAKIFRKYREMPGLESQLADYFDALQSEMNISTSEVGNIIISGNSSSDKSDLARAIVRAINYLYPERTRKIAKTTGDSINHRGLTKAMNKLKGTALIVEGAGSIQPKRMTEVLECLEQDTDRMIVILEDSDAEINVLLNFNPDMSGKFNHRIILKQYTVNELVEMARKFARKRQYEVDDDALLELYLKIDKLRSNTDNIRLDDVKEIINQAIVKSEKRASRKFFGGLKKKRGENGDIIFLSEADFKD